MLQAGDYTDPFSEAEQAEAAAQRAAKQALARPLGAAQSSQSQSAAQAASVGLPSPAPAPAAGGLFGPTPSPGQPVNPQSAGVKNLLSLPPHSQGLHLVERSRSRLVHSSARYVCRAAWAPQMTVLQTEPTNGIPSI